MGTVLRIPPDGFDYLDEAGAKRLRAKLTTYWFRRGFPGIEVSIVRVERQLKARSGRAIPAPYYVVRSNIGPDGFPPRQ